jgi:hypothetical protein
MPYSCSPSKSITFGPGCIHYRFRSGKSSKVRLNHNRGRLDCRFVTNIPEKQVVIAAGEGAKAALQANRYLQRLAL